MRKKGDRLLFCATRPPAGRWTVPLRKKVACPLFCAAWVLFLACGKTPGPGGLKVDVEYSAPGSGGCVRLTAVPLTGNSKSFQVELGSRPRAGHLFFGVGQAEGWPTDVTLAAAYLDDPCTGIPRKTDTLDTTFPASAVKSVSMTLLVAESDGGAAGGAGGGSSAGGAAGGSAGGAAGGSAGGLAGGMAGGAAGGSAGGAPAPTCDGGFVQVATPITGTIYDVALFGPGDVWIVGTGGGAHVAQRLAVDGGFFEPASGCTGNFFSVWSRDDGTAYLGSDNDIYRVSSAAGSCVSVTAARNSDLLGLAGLLDGGVELVSAQDDGTVGHRSDPVGISADPRPLASARAVAAIGRGLMFAAGRSDMNNRGLIVANTGGTTWAPVFSDPLDNTTLNDVALASPALGYAGGDSDELIAFDGGSWGPSGIMSPFPGGPGEINGLKVFPDGTIYAVGTTGRIFRSEGGGAFVEVANFGNVEIRRIRGTSRCDLWAVGAGGFVATTNHR